MNVNHLDSVISKLRDCGCSLEATSNSIKIYQVLIVLPVDLTTDVFPGFATDLQAQWVALMTIANGSSLITDTVYHDRFSHVPELNRFGANIKVQKNTAFVRGVKELVGAPVMSTDIRASASLIIAGLLLRVKQKLVEYTILIGDMRRLKKNLDLWCKIYRENS